jgi:hypothetical protein
MRCGKDRTVEPGAPLEEQDVVVVERREKVQVKVVKRRLELCHELWREKV